VLISIDFVVYQRNIVIFCCWGSKLNLVLSCKARYEFRFERGLFALATATFAPHTSTDSEQMSKILEVFKQGLLQIQPLLQFFIWKQFIPVYFLKRVEH